MDINIRLLGGFSVGRARGDVPAEAWNRRGAAALVKLLALADGRRMHREQVMDALWPELSVDEAGPRLHKAAHYARRALGEATALQLRHDLVQLLPDVTVSVDAVDFRRRAEAALAAGSVADAQTALEGYGGPLLPDDLYEPWTGEWRETVSVLHADLLRLARRWEELLRDAPADEEAHVALTREHADRGDVRAAVRQLERMDQALRRELGTVPGPEAERLRAELAARTGPTVPSQRTGPPPAAETPNHRLVGRRETGDAIRARLDRAAAGHGSTFLVTGAAGVGKSALLDLTAALAGRRGWRIARGGASVVEGSWPYAPVLEAFGDLCRRHPALLDGLDDAYRLELDRALSGGQFPWTGETAHQRLFVAAAELLRLAASGRGLLLVVDDVHEADEASLRLLHYLARCAVSEPVLIALASRPGVGRSLRDMQESLVARGIGGVIELEPLDEPATRRLLAHEFPDLDDRTAAEIWTVSGGLPFRALEAARAAERGTRDVAVSALPPDALSVLRRVALLGSAFTTDELLAASGTDEAEGYRALEAALATSVVEPAEAGYRFRHTLVREALLATFSAHERSRAGREVAERLAALGTPPARVAHLFLAAGHPVQAIPYALPAIETAGALGAYRDGLALIDAVLDHATGTDRAHLLARRGDLLMALADPEAVDAYRAAVSVTTGTEHRLVRARLARAATIHGDLDSADAAIAGLELRGDAADAPLLLARGNLAYFTGDVDGAWEAADAARSLLQPDDPWQILDLVGLQGLIAHQRGEWFERFRRELRRTQANPGLATTVFDAHLCVAEYLLYGPIPYDEVIDLAQGLRRRAEHHGALRGVAFAMALVGEAALLKGDLDLAERKLQEAADLHHDVDAPSGEALSLQRLAEVRLARGDRSGALELLQKALPLARWSMVSMHLMQRVYGTMIVAAEDPAAALVVVERAEATLGETDRCAFCDVMFAVPATVAYADAGDVEAAERYLAMAEVSGARWEGSAWDAAVAEARAHLEAARGRDDEFARWIDTATRLFEAAGQPLDAARCAALADGSRPLHPTPA
ncbi:MAG: ATP-binding protein [Nocardioidaceae bacterium]